MADWFFSSDYGTRYPALTASVLSLLGFSDHALKGTAFTGTLDLSGSPALAAFGSLAGITSLAMTGTVIEDAGSGSLTITLQAAEPAVFLKGLQTNLAVIGPDVRSGNVTIQVVTATTDSADDAPPTDLFQLTVNFMLGDHGIDIVGQVPLSTGFLTLVGTPVDVQVTIADLDSIITACGGGSDWFPTEQLGPYATDAALALLGVTLILYVPASGSTSVSSLGVELGITDIPLIEDRLYLNPLAVSVTVPSATPGEPATVALLGSVDLYKLGTSVPGGTVDFTLDLQMDLSSFALSADFDDVSDSPICAAVEDLIGEAFTVDALASITVDTLNIEAQADLSTGRLSSFSALIAMSGGFGFFGSSQAMQLSLEYSA